jgi:hypothetical protein
MKLSRHSDGSWCGITPDITDIIGRMDGPQLISVTGSIRQLMR